MILYYLPLTYIYIYILYYIYYTYTHTKTYLKMTLLLVECTYVNNYYAKLQNTLFIAARGLCWSAGKKRPFEFVLPLAEANPSRIGLPLAEVCPSRTPNFWPFWPSTAPSPIGRRPAADLQLAKSPAVSSAFWFASAANLLAYTKHLAR